MPSSAYYAAINPEAAANNICQKPRVRREDRSFSLSVHGETNLWLEVLQELSRELPQLAAPSAGDSLKYSFLRLLRVLRGGRREFWKHEPKEKEDGEPGAPNQKGLFGVHLSDFLRGADSHTLDCHVCARADWPQEEITIRRRENPCTGHEVNTISVEGARQSLLACSRCRFSRTAR